jgi:hypothetical protein
MYFQYVSPFKHTGYVPGRYMSRHAPQAPGI